MLRSSTGHSGPPIPPSPPKVKARTRKRVLSAADQQAAAKRAKTAVDDNDDGDNNAHDVGEGTGGREGKKKRREKAKAVKHTETKGTASKAKKAKRCVCSPCHIIIYLPDCLPPLARKRLPSELPRMPWRMLKASLTSCLRKSPLISILTNDDTRLQF